MGKKKKLNRFITKWIRSDLPEDNSTVLLIGITKIPTSPTPIRQPHSLPIEKNSIKFPKSSNDFECNGTSHSLGNKKIPCDAVSDFGNVSQKNNFNSVILKQTEELQLSATNNYSVDNLKNKSDIITHEKNSTVIMDQSVDSIGNCSLDVDVSANFSDISEASSAGTLRSISLPSASPELKPPSYLSLACTVNGYSTTINYNSERLSKSRDASPHRLYDNTQSLTYTKYNNFLSPPNLVPLPTRNLKMENKENISEHTMTRKFYSSNKTIFVTKETKNYTSTINSHDSVDSCLENGHFNGIQNKCMTFSSTNITIKESAQEYSNGNECKSFIQQRVERLYGPGALAQGYLVMKRNKNHYSQSEQNKNSSMNNDFHSKSMVDKIEDNSQSNMKQSTSSPALPVLRHLRPEFRAQLPVISPKKTSENSMQKSSTSPALKNQNKTNETAKPTSEPSKMNGNVTPKKTLEGGNSDVKDGHYFLKILDTEAKRLLNMAEQAEIELQNPDLSEEAKGYLRSASGKAKLLVSQKMQQFKGLCTNNIDQVEGEAFPTTNEDLQGFWDMVMLQVDQIDALFKELEILKENNWEEKKIIENKVTKQNGTSASKIKRIPAQTRPTSAVTEEARKQREVQRKQMIEERRKAMREKKQNAKEGIEIFVPESS